MFNMINSLIAVIFIVIISIVYPLDDSCDRSDALFKCNQAQSPIRAITVLEQITRKDNIILYAGRNISNEIIGSVELLKGSGNVIGVEFESSLFGNLIHNVNSRQLQNYTLLLSSNLFYDFHDNIGHDNMALIHCYSLSSSASMTDECRRYLKLSLNRVYDIIGSLCPHVVVIKMDCGESCQDITPLITYLLSGRRLLGICRPALYIDSLYPSITHATISLLEYIGYDNIYWDINANPLVDRGRNNQMKVGIFAYESLNLNTIDIEALIKSSLGHGYNLIKYQNGKYFASQYLSVAEVKRVLMSTASLEWFPSCIDGTLPPCHVYERLEYDFVDRSVINITVHKYKPSISPISIDFMNPDAVIDKNTNYMPITSHVCLGELLYDWKQDSSAYELSELYQSLEDLAVLGGSVTFLNISWDPFMSPVSNHGSMLHNLATVECNEWMIRVYAAAAKSYAGVHGQSFNYSQYEDNAIRLHNLLHEGDEMEKLSIGCVNRIIKLFTIQYHSKISIRQHLSNDLSRESYNKLYFPKNSAPFSLSFDSSACLEPIWCNHMLEMQRRIISWQYPDDPDSYIGAYDKIQYSGVKRTCASSKYLFYEPESTNHGIGSILEQLASAFRYAICLDRILVLVPPSLSSPTMSKWQFPGCRKHSLECYFKPIHGCQDHITSDDFKYAAISDAGRFIDEYPLKQARFVRLSGLPSYGPCALCGSSWKSEGLSHDSHSSFFNGLGIDRDPTNPSSATTRPPVDAQFQHLSHMGSMMTTIKSPWIAQFVRFIFRLQPWFSGLLSEIGSSILIGPNNTAVNAIPHPFVSMHIRYGMKVLEENLVPLEKYVEAMKRKYPYTKNIFVSTETESVIHSLIRDYPEFNIYYLDYPRVEYLDLPMLLDGGKDQDFVGEWVYSMANLYISTEADGFIGTLTSNWCALIHHLERTRGDGGYDYFSVDRGSAYTSCF